MLFIESRTAERRVDTATRLALLTKLQEKGLTPLIRSARLSSYEQALLGPERVDEMERAVASWTEAEDDSPYVRGELFCSEEFVLFLIFGRDDDETAGMRAGIVYGAEMLEPLKKLDAFCRNVTDSLAAISGGGTHGADESADEEWKARPARSVAGLWRFNAEQEVNSSAASRGGETGPPARAVELLEDVEARRLLRRIAESQAEGRVSEIVSGAESEAVIISLINRMADAGLLRREVLVSCRRKGRSLFRLPTPDALNVITTSSAMCSECGAAIADEKIEDLVKPTETAAQLLEDGSWLSTRVYAALRELGVPEQQIVLGPTSDDGEAHMMVSVCNEPFLLVLRDGDVTATQARHALAMQLETEATHLVVVSSGKIQDEARVRLREHARRRLRGGSDVEVILIEGLEVSEELRRAFERVSRQALAGELSALDASLGLSVGFIVATRFRLMHQAGALKDLAESAVGALAGSLREF